VKPPYFTPEEADSIRLSVVTMPEEQADILIDLMATAYDEEQEGGLTLGTATALAAAITASGTPVKAVKDLMGGLHITGIKQS
jgi:hypothetical protein